MARERNAVVCFEATGGCEWPMWDKLHEEGVDARQLPPGQIKAFAKSLGKRAKTDRIDAMIIAMFMEFRPDAGRKRPRDKLRELRALVRYRAQVVEARKTLKQEIKARERQGMRSVCADLAEAQMEMLDHQVSEMEGRIRTFIVSDRGFHKTATILSSVPGIGPVATSVLICEMPEMGRIGRGKIASLAGLAPCARDCGASEGKRSSAAAEAGARRRVPGGPLGDSPQSGHLRVRGPAQGEGEAHEGRHRRRGEETPRHLQRDGPGRQGMGPRNERQDFGRNGLDF